MISRNKEESKQFGKKYIEQVLKHGIVHYHCTLSGCRYTIFEKLELVDLVLEIIGGFEAEQPKGVGEPCSPR